MPRTDQIAIQWLKYCNELTGQLARRLERLSAYDFILQYCSGRMHLNADALVRKSTTDKCLAITHEEDDIFDMKFEQLIVKFVRQFIQWVITDTRVNIEQILNFDYEDKLL